MLAPCSACPRRCGVDRLAGEKGFCGAGKDILVAHFGPHFGEEPPISGARGSGNIFFSFCNLRCVFCQNYQISHEGQGGPVSLDGLVEMFFSLQAMGCHNVNLVSPTPYVPFIAAAIGEAKRRGIGIPFVYNTNGYDAVDALRSLDGLIDIYLPDFKYWNPAIAERLSGPAAHAPYPECAREALIEMKCQVGDLLLEDGIAKRGLLVRHLVLPGGLAGSRAALGWIAETLGKQTSIGLMSQYLPLHRSGEHPILSRRIRQEEYDNVVSFLINNGMENVFTQDLESAPLYVPDFGKEQPFGEGGGEASK